MKRDILAIATSAGTNAGARRGESYDSEKDSKTHLVTLHFLTSWALDPFG